MLIIKKRTIYFIFLILFIIPTGLTSFGALKFIGTVIQYGKYLAFFCIVLDAIMNYKVTLKEYKFSLLAGAFGASFLVYLLVNPHMWTVTYIKFYLLIVANYFCAAYLVEYFMKSNLTFFIKKMDWYYSILIYINFIFMILKPEGFNPGAENKKFLIAIDNGLVLYMIAGVMIAWIYRYITNNKKSINAFLLTVIATASCVISGSATALVAICILDIILIGVIVFGKLGKLKSLLNLKTVSIVYLVFSYLVLYGNILEKFSDFIINVLHRDPTLTARTFLWERAIILIKESPFYGWGFPRDSSEFAIVDEWGTRLTSHNNLLEIMVRGGIFSMLFVILFIFYTHKKTKKYKNNDVIVIITGAFLALLIFYFSEVSFSVAGWNFILAILVNGNYLIRSVGKSEGKEI